MNFVVAINYRLSHVLLAYKSAIPAPQITYTKFVTMAMYHGMSTRYSSVAQDNVVFWITSDGG